MPFEESQKILYLVCYIAWYVGYYTSGGDSDSRVLCTAAAIWTSPGSQICSHKAGKAPSSLSSSHYASVRPYEYSFSEPMASLSAQQRVDGKSKWTNLEALPHTAQEMIFPFGDCLLHLVLSRTFCVQPVEEGLDLLTAINQHPSYPQCWDLLLQGSRTTPIHRDPTYSGHLRYPS